MKKDIILSGKGGGGGSFQEDDNTLKSVTWVKTLEAIGYGLQVGPARGAKSIYLDNTAILNEDNTWAFTDVVFDTRNDLRLGLPSQTAIRGFEEVTSVISVATDVLFATPIVRTSSSANIGKMSITIRLPQGLYNQNTTDNKLEKTKLNFVIETKLTSSGVWTTALDKTYNDKAVGPYEESFEIPRPTGTGTWDVRVRRVTPDSTASTLKNGLNFAYYSEHLLETITYPNVALLALSVNASGVNSTRVPTRSVLWKGRIIRVPNVYDGETRTYSGVWNLSTFKNQWTNDPAWVIFDLATDDVVGLGLSDSQIDLTSFYEASIYNSQQVPFKGIDNLDYSGPRYSFNAPIDTASSPIDWMKKVASTMNATLLWVNGQLTLVQDRPTDFSYVFTNANVIDGVFNRSETPYDTRYTAVNVTWNAPADNYQQRVTSVSDSAGVALYGFQETNVAAFGCTSYSQAIRYGRWILESSLNTYKSISFTTGEIGATLLPGDVIRIYDNVYAGADAAGRLLSGSTTSFFLLDRSVTLVTPSVTFQDSGDTVTRTNHGLVNGQAVAFASITGTSGISINTIYYVVNATANTFQVATTKGGTARALTTNGSGTLASLITIWGTDGTLFADSVITSVGTTNSIAISTALASAPGEESIFQISTNSISPETYKIIEREEVESGKFQILAGQYDENKYARIEGNVSLLQPIYSGYISAVTQPPTSLAFSERSTTLDLSIQRTVIASWTPVPNQAVTGYKVTYTLNGGNKNVVDVKLPFIEIDVTVGALTVQVQSIGYSGQLSMPVYGSYTIAATETTGSLLNPVTNLVVYGTAGTTFTTPDLIFQWTNPTTNGSTSVSVARFKVEIYNGATLLRSEYVEGVAPGQNQTYTYSFDNNRVDGGPRRSIIAKVYAQDAGKKLSSATTATFTNAAPAAPSGLVVTGGVGQVFVTCTASADSDYKGTIVWASLTNGFTPASGNVVYDGSDNLITFKSLGAGTHYLKIAHYDSFGKDYAGTGLNLSAQQTATPVSNAGIQSGTANPGTGTEGDLFFNTTDGKLYRYHSSAWTAAVPTVDLTGTVTTAQIADAALTTAKFASNIEPVTIVSAVPGTKSTNSIFNTADGKLYRWNGSSYVASVPTSDLSGQITTTQITDNSITTAKVAAGAITASNIASGTITSTQIAADTITAGNIAASAIGTSELAAGAVTAAKISAGTITANEIAAGTITSTQIAADTITSGNIAANAITSSELAANAVTAGKIAASSITSNEIAANTITASNIASSTITGSRIAANTISASNIVTGTITAASGVIADAAITTAKIADAAITTAKIGSLAVGTAQINDAAITTAKIGDLAVSTLKIEDQAVTIPASATAASWTFNGTVNMPTALTILGVASKESLDTLLTSLTVVSTGAPAVIIAGTSNMPNGPSTGSGAQFCRILLYRDSTLIAQSYYSSTARGVPESIYFRDTGATAGTHTYYLYFRYAQQSSTVTGWSVNNTSFNFFCNSSIIYLETKK